MLGMDARMPTPLHNQTISAEAKDPVCGMTVDPDAGKPRPD